MKKVITVLTTLALALSLTACQHIETATEGSSQPPVSQPAQSVGLEPMPVPTAQSEDRGDRILIAYFTLGRNAEYPDEIDATTSASLVLDGEQLVGTTEYVAQLIQDNVGGEMHLIETVEPYPTNFDMVVDQNHEEMAEGTLPELAPSDLDMNQYDTVFIGYPIWAANAPQAVFSFLSQYDMSGKTVIPFCTHNGYGAGGSYFDIADAIEGETAVLDGLAIEASDVPGAADTVTEWLQEIGVEAAQSNSAEAKETAITITIGDTVLDGVLYDTALAQEISQYFPFTISTVGYADREYYGDLTFTPQKWNDGRITFEKGDISYCADLNCITIFYDKSEEADLAVEVAHIGRITSDLSVFKNLPQNVDITFAIDKS